jgi:hypothetical protein
MFPLRTQADPEFRKPDRTKPYGNGIFKAILRNTVFKDFRSIGFRIGDRFYSSIEELADELETPPAMMSFLSTSVCFRIMILSTRLDGLLGPC